MIIRGELFTGQEVADGRRPQLSVVIPVNDEEGAILALIDETIGALTGRLDFEIVVVDDGSTDGTAGRLESARRFLPVVRVVTHSRRVGQSAALMSGVRAARAEWVATMDGDGQNDPADVLELWEARTERPGATMLCGQRRKRRDVLAKRIASRIANAVRSRVLGDGVADTGCGLKLVHRELYLRLPAFDHMHRFLPALAQLQGAEVATVGVGHRPRRTGRSSYGIFDRLGVGIVDLLGVWWLGRRRFPPLPTVDAARDDVGSGPAELVADYAEVGR